MSSHRARVQRQSPFENKRLNLIPVGRQLQRTPPTRSANLQITPPSEDPAIKDESSRNVVQVGTPRGQGDAPSGQVSTPRGQDDTPCGHNSTLRGQGDAPSGQYLTPREQGDAPSGQYLTPREQGDAPSGQYLTPREQGDASSWHYLTPSRHYGPPSGQDDATCPSVKEEKSYRRSSLTPASAKMANADPGAFIQGMQGYQWTDADLEFVYQAKQQKRAQQLQQELSEVKKTLQAETQRLELAVASRDQLRSELSKTPSCDSLLQLCKSILSRSQTSDQLDALGEKALLSLLNLQDVQRALRQENAEIRCLEREAAKAQELRDEEEKAMKEMDEGQQKISTLQGNVDALKVELSDLETQLSEKELASKATQAQRKVRRAAKAQAISDAPNTTEEKDTEEMNRSRATAIEKGRKGSRRAKPSTKTLKEKVLKETSGSDTKEKTGKDMVRKGKTAPKEKAPNKATSRKPTTPEEMASNETVAQNKIQVEMDLKTVSSKGKFLKIEEDRSATRMGKTPPTSPQDKGQNKAENELVPTEMTNKEVTKKGKTAPNKTTLKKTAQKELAPDETTSQVETPGKLSPKEVPSRGKASNVVQVLENGRKGSRTAKTSTTAPKDKVLKKTALKELTEHKMVTVETGDKLMAENISTFPKIKAPVRRRKSGKKQLVPDETAFEEQTPEKTASVEMAPEELLPNVKASNVAEVWQKGLRGSRTNNSSTTALKGRASKKTDRRETVEKNAAQIQVDETVKTARKVKAPKKATSKNTAEKNLAPKQTASQVKTLDDNVLVTKVHAQKMMTLKKSDELEMVLKAQEDTSLEETASKVKASKLKAPKKTADVEMSVELIVERATVTKKTTSKLNDPKKATLKKTDRKKMAMQETAEDEGALKRTVLKKGLKDASKKETAVKNKIRPKTDLEETVSESMGLKEVDEEATITRTEGTTSRKRAPKDKAPKQKAVKHSSEDEDSLNATHEPKRAQQATRPPTSPETLRRSKRNTVKNPSLNKTIPEKTTRSLRR